MPELGRESGLPERCFLNLRRGASIKVMGRLRMREATEGYKRSFDLSQAAGGA